MKELEDYTWFPNILRRFQMEFIGWVVYHFHIYKGLVPHLDGLFKASKQHSIFDLCSGTGDPVRYLLKHTSCKAAVLTDKFPQEHENHDSMVYKRESVDALQLDLPQQGLVTMFNAFHHFDETQQFKLLQRLATHHQGFCIVEILQPHLLDVLKIAFTTTIGQVLVTPFIRPFSWKRLLFTYLFPINLITITYDGVVSVLKSGSLKYYEAMTKNLLLDQYKLNVKMLPSSWGSRLLVISGYSNKEDD